MRYSLLFVLFFISIISKAQEAKDTTGSESYVDVNLSVGDNYFTRKPVASNSPEKKVYYSLGAGYYHKSGLSLSFISYLTPDKTNLTLYQTSITPAFDYEKGKHVWFGLSYTYYANKDSVSFYQSPLVHEVNGYVTYKNKFVDPSLIFTYATGSRKVKVLNQVRTLTGTDYYLTLSLTHDFDWWNTISKDDELTFTPTFSIITGKSEFGLSGKTQQGRLNTVGRANQSQSKFELQDLNLELSLHYSIGKFYFEPAIILDYYLPEGGSFSSLEYLTIGLNF